jgi:transcriptional regulator with XRE-family HTH domain
MPNPRPHLFSAALASLLQERGFNQVQLHELTGIAISRVNNYLHGVYRTIKPAHVEAISKALCNTPASRAALIQAYLFDLIPEGCRGWVDIRVHGAKETGKWKVPAKGLPEGFADAFRNLYVLCASNPKARQRTAEWIELMRETKR